MSKPPLYLPPTTDEPLKVSLIIGSPDYDPLSVRLFDLVLPRSKPAPVHPDEVKFHPQPELFHTFRPDQKVPPKFISLVFTGVVLAPWVVLLGLVRHISFPTIYLRRQLTVLSFQWSQVFPSLAHLFSPSIFPFVLSLGAFETLLFTYWVKLKLGDVLLYGAVLGVVTIFTGRQALSSISSRRKD